MKFRLLQSFEAVAVLGVVVLAAPAAFAESVPWDVPDTQVEIEQGSDADTSDDAGPDLPPDGDQCVTDQDCWEGPGGTCWDGWCVYEPPGSCSADIDCATGEVCIWGYCEDATGYCKVDADCGAYAYCDLTWGGSGGGEVPPPEPAFDAGSGSGSADAGSGSADAGSTDASPPPPDAEWDVPPDAPEWGICYIDVDEVPTNDDCVTICTDALPCVSGMEPPPEPGVDAGSGGGSADAGSGGTPVPSEDAATEACIAMCNYGMAVTTGVDLSGAATCVEAAADCDAVVQDCGDELDALGNVFDDLPADLPPDFWGGDPPVGDVGPVDEGPGEDVTGPDPDLDAGPTDTIPGGDDEEVGPAPDPTPDASDGGNTFDISADVTVDITEDADWNDIDGPYPYDVTEDATAEGNADTTPNADTGTAGNQTSDDSDGCAAGGSGGSAASWMLLALLGLVVLRRRRTA